MVSPSQDRILGTLTSVAVKAPCRVATTAAIALTGLQTVDGVALAADDRVLVKDQASAQANGIYVVSVNAWARAADLNGARDAVKGTTVRVVEGNDNQGFWELTSANPVVVGSSDLTWLHSTNLLAGVSAYIQTLLDDANAATARATLGSSATGDAVFTAATAAAARGTLGAVIGTDVQAWDADLDAIAALAKADGNFIIGNGSAWIAESSATARASLGVAALSAMPNVLHGLGTSNNATDPTNDIDIAVGAAKDTTSVAIMALAAALIKRIDAAWAVGTNQGGLDGTESVPGTPDNDTWYYVWLIERSDTGVVDALFSESSTAPTMPTNYDRKRLIGAVRRETATNKKFYQDEGWFRLQAAVEVVSAGTATANTAVTLTPAVPPIAESFTASAKSTLVVTNNAASNDCVVGVAAGIDYARLAELTDRLAAATTGTFANGGGEHEIPNTGTFTYRNVQANTDSRNSTIRVHGFKLTR